jgi:signal transduction histidine kinase
MKVESHISVEYPKVNPYEGVNVIEKSLIESKFMVVCDEENSYYGILRPSDIITKPHKLVVDCLSQIPAINSEQDIRYVFDLMISKHYTVLPVFKDETFIGIISAERIAQVAKAHTEYLSDIIIENKAEIENIKKEAQVSERLKDSFLRNINHEIRTPLAGIVGFSSLLIMENKTKEEKEEYTEILERSTDRFLKVMDNIINLSRIQAGDDLLFMENEGTIDELIREIYLYYKEVKKKSNKDRINFKFNCQIADNRVYNLDYSKIKQILGYLIDNSLKFTNEGEIEIGCIPDVDKALKFYVKDTGIGIPPEKIEHIFEAFNKISIGKESFFEGLGLGLSIAKKLADSLGVGITVESLVGKGSCFTLIIPVVNK